MIEAIPKMEMTYVRRFKKIRTFPLFPESAVIVISRIYSTITRIKDMKFTVCAPACSELHLKLLALGILYLFIRQFQPPKAISRLARNYSALNLARNLHIK